MESEKYDKAKTAQKGKIYTLTCDKTGDGKIDVTDLDWDYLKGDGDFRSAEVKELRDGADIIITNPPFLPCSASFWRGWWKPTSSFSPDWEHERHYL